MAFASLKSFDQGYRRAGAIHHRLEAATDSVFGDASVTKLPHGLILVHAHMAAGPALRSAALMPPGLWAVMVQEGRPRTQFSGHADIHHVAGRAIVVADRNRFEGATSLEAGEPARFMAIGAGLPWLEALAGLPGDSGIERLVRAPSSLLHCPMSPRLRSLCAVLTQPQTGLMLEARATEILSLLCEAEGMPHPAPALGAQAYRCLSLAHDILLAEWRDPPSLLELARRSGLGLTRLKDGFRTFYGASPHAFAASLRLEAARRLLEDGASVAEAAWQVGTTASHLSAVFRDRFGTTPGSIRRQVLASSASFAASTAWRDDEKAT